MENETTRKHICYRQCKKQPTFLDVSVAKEVTLSEFMNSDMIKPEIYGNFLVLHYFIVPLTFA